jgi:hypothetical protein
MFHEQRAMDRNGEWPAGRMGDYGCERSPTG